MTIGNHLIPIEERILLHILNFQDNKEKIYAPKTLIRGRIADAVGTHRNYIYRIIEKLVSEGYLTEYMGRVKGSKRKLKCYQLTVSGRKYTLKLKEELSKMDINLKYENGSSTTMKLKDAFPSLINKEIQPEITELDIYNAISNEGILDIKQLKKQRKICFIDFSSEAPNIIHFFGRKKELQQLNSWLSDKGKHNLIFIHGMAGIGKTTLTAKLIEEHRQFKHLFWHNFHSLDTLRGVLFKLSEFLSELGDDHLQMYLRARTALDHSEVSRILKKSIGVIDAILVFDDLHKCSENIREFFVYILKMLESPSNTKIIMLGREIVPFYDSRDVLTKKVVAELELGGLDFESSKVMLKKKGIDKRMVEEIYILTAGNPLFLEIIESRNHLERYIHDELLLKLEEDEKKILKMISIYRFPIEEETLTSYYDIDTEKLFTLTQKSIVKIDANDRYFIHDILKHFFYRKLTRSEKKMYHMQAAQYFATRDTPIELIEAVYHHQESGEHEKACLLAINNSEAILEAGYVSELLVTLDLLDEREVKDDIWAKILILKGKASYMIGEWKQALRYIAESEDMVSVIGDNKLKVDAICESGLILEEHNELDRARDCFKKCLEISKSEDYPIGMGIGYRGIGRIHWRKSEHDKAIKNYKKCLKISEETGDLRLAASTYIDLGNVYDEKYKTEKAIECYNKSLDILKTVKNTNEIARAYTNLAVTYRHNGEFNEAIEYYNRSLVLAKDIKDIKRMGYDYAGIGGCFAKIEKFENARDYAKKAENIALKIENENIMFDVNRTYALICKHEKKWEDAIRYFEKSIEIVEKLNALFYLSHSHLEFGLLYKDMGDIDNAKKHIAIAEKLYGNLDGRESAIIKEKLSNIGDIFQ